MKRIVSIFLLLFMIFLTYVAFAEDIAVPELTTGTEDDVGPEGVTRTSEVRVNLQSAMVLAYECPVRKRFVYVTFAAEEGPEPIRVGIKYLDTEQDHWVPLESQTQLLDVTETATFKLPYNARYRVYVQNAGATFGFVTLYIDAAASSTS